MNTTIRTESFSFSDVRTYIAALLFVAGNVALPQFCHLFPAGGLTWLPIYLFTLIGAGRYGWRVGLLTAIASPLVNSLLFGMPSMAVLPSIMIKSVMLALSAGYAFSRYGKFSLPVLMCVILGYQIPGTLAEWAICGDFHTACQDFRIGIPGMTVQLIAGRLILGKLNSF